jgi:predicted 2-oxoglutarate/Fe(II)-dependent dioxygenase YbiX
MGAPWTIKPGFFGTSSANIVIHRNFVDLDELKQIQKFCRTNTHWGLVPFPTVTAEDESIATKDTIKSIANVWEGRICQSSTIQQLDNTIWELINKCVAKKQNTIEDFFKVRLVPRHPVVVRWMSGDGQGPHADKQLLNGEPNHLTDYDMSSVLYYNDDFDGGELYFPQHDIQIKPEPGLCVMFPGDINYIHGVTQVSNGVRYTTPSFYPAAC